jgi:hypothetical protein
MSQGKASALEKADLRRAAISLIAAHGERKALAVAGNRADNAVLSGAFEAARTWRQIAGVLETMRKALRMRPPRLGTRFAARLANGSAAHRRAELILEPLPNR